MCGPRGGPLAADVLCLGWRMLSEAHAGVSVLLLTTACESTITSKIKGLIKTINCQISIYVTFSSLILKAIRHNGNTTHTASQVCYVYFFTLKPYHVLGVTTANVNSDTIF